MKFQNPEIEVIKFAVADVMTTSNLPEITPPPGDENWGTGSEITWG